MRSARGRQDERGAVIPVVALAMVVILGIAMLAVDLGVQRVARRDMQRLADAVALDLSRLIDGRTASQIEAGNSKKASLAAAKAASVSRNKGTTLGHDTDVTATLVTLDALGSPVRNGDGSLRVASGSAVPDAVLVRATTQVNFAFHGGQGGAGNTGTGDGDGSLGVPRSEACFKLGSFAAALTAANTPILNRYLNSALNLNAVSYQGLAGASMTLGELAAELGAGSTSELASIKNLSLRELFSASAAVLTSQGGSAAAVSVLQTLATTVDGSLLIDMDEVIDLSTGSSAALATSMNVLDLVAGAAFVANGNSFLNVPVMWNVPQFSNGSLNMQIIEGPQMACGKVGSAQVETAQVRFQAAPTLNVPSIAGLNGSAVPVLLDVSLAGASGLLTGITCGEATAASPESLKVNVSRQLSSVNLSIPIRLTGSIKASDVLLPAGWSLFGLLALLPSVQATFDITINAGYSSTTPAGSQAATYAVPPHDYSDPERIGGSGGVVIPSTTIDSSDISGTVRINGITRTLGTQINLGGQLDLSSIINDLVQKNVVSGINGFISNVNAELAPLTQLLGLEVGGADLYGVPRPACATPSLGG